MGTILFHEIKRTLRKNLKELLLLILAFTCSCVAINITLYNFLNTFREHQAATESYEDRSFYKLWLNGEDSVFQRVLGSGAYLETKKAVFEDLKEEKAFEYLYRSEMCFQFYGDETYNWEDFPSYMEECLAGYGENEAAFYSSETILSLKGFLADRLLEKEKHISLEEGDWFSEEDFYVTEPANIELSVILGSAYRELYEVGDTLENAHLGTTSPVTLHVIGFFKGGSFFYDNNNEKVVLDRYMVAPNAEPAYPLEMEGEADGSYYAEAYGNVLMNARIVCEEEEAERTRERVYEILHRNKLYELKLVDETGGEKLTLASMEDMVKACIAITVFMLVLGILMFCFQAYYKLLKNKKAYGVYILNGMIQRQIFLLMIMDSVVVFLLSDILFALLYIWNTHYGYIDLGLMDYTIPVLLFIQVILLLFMGGFGSYKIKQMDMVSSLREHE